MAIFKASGAIASVPGVTLIDGLHPEVRTLLQDVVTAAGGSPAPATAAPTGAPTAAASSTSSSALPSAHAAAIALVLFVGALVPGIGIIGDHKGPTFTPAQGVGAFALFYVVAQAAERVVEIAMPLCEKIVAAAGGTPKSARVKARDDAVAAAVSALGGTVAGTAGGPAGGTAGPDGTTAAEAAQNAADKQAEVDQARADRTLMSFGATGALGMLLCAYLHADFLSAIGVHFASGANAATGLARVVMVAVTGLVVGAGSKQLNDTISTISKSSAQKATPAETGGTR